ncbi:uncharacterized protein BCR38DRAFT_349559 [Pseudomassariella vexata]|uniref:Peptidase M20 domain-containing protein 2 n=1 Tax=Pseudomassariella vexata TaxID=1141098 RepID=A0A1Y2DP40_9PEZI|nr:uncharacterized protein BCR38DRAFT_349559 [Pseudomassariella vexata]ORY60934.1 hypothetical protein BCR38DRAFT_349559 [Pseudomassariella vexata]
MEDENIVLVSHDDVDTMPPHLAEVSNFVDSVADDLWSINKRIHDNPELGYHEHDAHATLTTFMKSRNGWKVTTSAYGMETAWLAVYDSGEEGSVVSFNVEMDALPGIGHACGHNLIAIASLAAGLATSSVLQHHQLPGRVVIFGTPAEEGGGGKIRLLRAGAFQDHGVDLSLISHPGVVHDRALVATTAYAQFRVEYFGRAAHAANSPWLGINALDALIVAYNAISVLRQQTMPGDVIQGHITDGGTAPNIIHAYVAGVFVVRAPTAVRLRELREKVNACFHAGATATGARLEITLMQMYKDHVPNRVLGTSYVRCWNALDPPTRITIPTDDRDGGVERIAASTDQGDVSYKMPSLNVSFSIPSGVDGGGPHSPGFAAAAGTKEAFLRSLRTGKAIAGTAVDVLATPGLLEKVKEQWEKDMAFATNTRK